MRCLLAIVVNEVIIYKCINEVSVIKVVVSRKYFSFVKEVFWVHTGVVNEVCIEVGGSIVGLICKRGVFFIPEL